MSSGGDNGQKSSCPDQFRLFAQFFGREGFRPEHDESLVEHVNGCPHCHKLLEEWEKTDGELTSTAPQPVPPEVMEMAVRMAAGSDVVAIIEAGPNLKFSLQDKAADLLGFRFLLPAMPEPIRSADAQAPGEVPACRVEAIDPSTLGLHFYGSESMIQRIAPADFIVVYSEPEKSSVVGRVARSRPTELRVRFPNVNLNLPFHILIVQ